MRIRNYVISLLSMGVVSVISLIVLGVLTYNLKWKADTAMLGITVTYILSGLVGGFVLKRTHSWTGRKREAGVQAQKANVTISKKMQEAILTATVFMGILFLLSVVLVQEDFSLSSRFFMIWMLITGSACLGRIL